MAGLTRVDRLEKGFLVLNTRLFSFRRSCRYHCRRVLPTLVRPGDSLPARTTSMPQQAPRTTCSSFPRRIKPACRRPPLPGRPFPNAPTPSQPSRQIPAQRLRRGSVVNTKNPFQEIPAVLNTKRWSTVGGEFLRIFVGCSLLFTSFGLKSRGFNPVEVRPGSQEERLAGHRRRSHEAVRERVRRQDLEACGRV